MKIALTHLNYRDRWVIVTLVMSIFFILGNYLKFSDVFLITNILSILITIFIWKTDGILKIDFKIKYILYYSTLILVSLYVYPKEIDQLLEVLIRAPIREELLFRLFMVGIFYKYYKSEPQKIRYFVNPIITSNIIFMILHYNISIFFIGIIFTVMYIEGGLLSSIFAHTLYNLYLSNDFYIIKLLVFLPLIFSIKKIQNVVENY